MGEAIARHGYAEAKLEIIPDILVHFRRCDDYKGEFGFDWLRDEYIHSTTRTGINPATWEDEEVEVPPIVSDAKERERLKREYKYLFRRDGDDTYFIPWLSMFAGHEGKIGHKVKLQLKAEARNNARIPRNFAVEFECPAAVRVVPERVEISRDGAPPEVEIICDAPCAGGQILIKSIGGRRSQTSETVGALELFPNHRHKELPLKIRLVHVLRNEHLAADRAFLNERTPRIIDYLKKQSLQQALIVPEFDETKELRISEAEWLADGRLISNQNSEIVIAGNTHRAIEAEYIRQHEPPTEEIASEVYEEFPEFKKAREDSELRDTHYVLNYSVAGNGKKAV